MSSNSSSTTTTTVVNEVALTDINIQDLSNDENEIGLSGYLFKKTRDGRWQRRWFETNGVYLTYYKSRKMEKLLAALSLPQVGEIKTLPLDQDPEKKGGLFTIELNTRVYTLRAKSDIESEVWVKILQQLQKQGSHQAQNLQTPNSKPKASLLTNNMEVSAGGNWIKGKKICCCF